DGTNANDKITAPFDRNKAGLITLWEPTNPQTYGLTPIEKYIVSNGHHRIGAAKDQNLGPDYWLNSQILRESAGVSANEARTQAAWSNIADGKGTVQDQAIFIRNQTATHGSDAALERARQIGARSAKAAVIGTN